MPAAVLVSGLSQARLRLIIVCRQEPGKGTEHVIASLPHLIERFPQVGLDVVGDGSALAGHKHWPSPLGWPAVSGFTATSARAKLISLLRRAVLHAVGQ